MNRAAFAKCDDIVSDMRTHFERSHHMLERLETRVQSQHQTVQIETKSMPI